MSKWIKAELPDELHKWLRLRAVERDQTLSETIIELLQQAKEADNE
jgi:macrodomain Ter protein organizer (MatP/YcbG family)